MQARWPIFSSNDYKVVKCEAAERGRIKWVCLTQTSGDKGIWKESNPSCFLFSLRGSVLNRMGNQTTLWECPQLLKQQEILCGPVYQSLSQGISYVYWSWKPDFFPLNHSYVSLQYYEMGFLPMLKETADVSVPLWYEKFNLKGWEKEWCTAYFHSPTLRDMRMMFYCVEEMMPIVLRRNSFIIQFNFF